MKRYGWSRPYSSVKEILLKPDRSVVKLWGWIDKIESPYKKDNDKNELVIRSKATIRDSKDKCIETAELSIDKFKKLSKMFEKVEPVELLCEVVPKEIGKDKWRNEIYVLAAASGASPLSRTEPSDHELKLVEAFLSKRSNQGFKLLNEIREAVCEYTKTVFVEKDSPYLDFINFLILQSVSCGFVGKTSGKLHSCAIGPPGVGKGHLVEIIRILNPIFEESQVQRVTEAGITASMNQKRGIWEVEPGKMPKANLGIYVIQDFDKCNNKSLIYNIFTYVMEEGKVIISGAADVTLAAATAIHIDLNRQSDLYTDKVIKGLHDDIDMPANIISRLDYVSVIDEDIRSQAKKGQEIIKAQSQFDKQLKSTIAKYCRKSDIEFGRFLKILIGHITTKYEHIDLTAVSKRIDREYTKLLSENDDINNLSKYSGRISTSIQKFISAATRIQLRKNANKKAVNMAVQMLERKLEFLRQWHSATMTAASSTPKKRKSAFAKWLFEQYSSKAFAPEKVIELYREHGNPCSDVADSTLRNWIREVAVSEKQNKWSIRKEILEHF